MTLSDFKTIYNLKLDLWIEIYRICNIYEYIIYIFIKKNCTLILKDKILLCNCRYSGILQKKYKITITMHIYALLVIFDCTVCNAVIKELQFLGN